MSLTLSMSMCETALHENKNIKRLIHITKSCTSVMVTDNDDNDGDGGDDGDDDGDGDD